MAKPKLFLLICLSIFISYGLAIEALIPSAPVDVTTTNPPTTAPVDVTTTNPPTTSPINGATTNPPTTSPVTVPTTKPSTTTPQKRCTFTLVSHPYVYMVTPTGPLTTTRNMTDSITSTKKTTARANLLSPVKLDNSVQYVAYNGTNCDVKFEFWTNQNYTGSYRYYTRKGYKTGKLILTEFMAKAVSSYRFSYL